MLLLKGAWVQSLVRGLRSFVPSGVTKKDVLFITGDWNAKAGSQETPGSEVK